MIDCICFSPARACALFPHRDFDLHVESHTDLFHPDFRLRVVGDEGQVVTKTVDGRAIVIGHVEGT